jgi:hypothetical protein
MNDRFCKSYSVITRTLFQEFEYRVNHDPEYLAEQRHIESHAIPQGIWQRKYPLANRNRWNHTVDEMCGGAGQY